MRLSSNDVRSLLPQQYPFIFVDSVLNYETHDHITCLKNVSFNEWFFPGHFPNNSIFPGVLLIEGMCQSIILLYKLSISKTGDVEKNFLFTGIKKARFLDIVKPGDQVIYKCKFVKIIEQAIFAEAEALVGDKVIAKAELNGRFSD
ncbi:3-hydroxyacyl-ACP dehydratase FabZ [Shouchella tritolerans]|uniref:3-hydroxyacyl-ACP dehydratase FabZ n=1 Tax=Shouchella tritolerans TaxID=2979466 RepID=UPI0021E85058|nr:3-hydroxyacyl-ACP dehydratase FabZ [Shouchella tritolerans]